MPGQRKRGPTLDVREPDDVVLGGRSEESPVGREGDLLDVVGVTVEEVRRLFVDFYRDSFFVRLVEGSPDINWVKTTNFCDIGTAIRGRQLVVFSALDNLVKGAAGQAVQNMNLMAGLDEKTGLMLIGTNP